MGSSINNKQEIGRGHIGEGKELGGGGEHPTLSHVSILYGGLAQYSISISIRPVFPIIQSNRRFHRDCHGNTIGFN